MDLASNPIFNDVLRDYKCQARTTCKVYCNPNSVLEVLFWDMVIVLITCEEHREELQDFYLEFSPRRSKQQKCLVDVTPLSAAPDSSRILRNFSPDCNSYCWATWVFEQLTGDHCLPVSATADPAASCPGVAFRISDPSAGRARIPYFRRSLGKRSTGYRKASQDGRSAICQSSTPTRVVSRTK